MRKIYAVIGVNWGDEGKGLITDYLADPLSLVVRYNGGAQAGHTVYHRRGKHVFHHIGSGSFKKAATFLSKYFVSNPCTFYEEFEALSRSPVIFIDPLALITTPWDIMINQALEKKRADNRHGSCGLGFNETLYRNKHCHGVNLCALDLEDSSKLPTILDKLFDYLHMRLKMLEIDPKEIPHFYDTRVRDVFLHDLEYMASHVKIIPWVDLCSKLPGNIIFEGAQGLQLDMDNAQYPYVTPSKTGLSNVVDLMQSASLTETIEAYYVTRCYITRHGQGPMPHNYDISNWFDIVDTTNLENEYQGKMRFSWLDLDCLISEILKDIGTKNVNLNLAVTCLDQVKKGVIGYVKDHKEHLIDIESLASLIKFHLDCSSLLFSYGPTSEDIKAFLL